MIKSLDNTPVHALFSVDNNVIFHIPKYQREYTWGKREWDALLEDLVENDNPQGHFLGTIICVNTTANTTDSSTLEVIDGQQRLTTLSLLLAAVYSLLNEHREELTDEDDKSDVVNLRKMLSLRRPARLRLKPQAQASNDKDYEAVMSQAGVIETTVTPKWLGNRRIKKAYEHFRDQIVQYAETAGQPLPDTAFRLLEKIKMAFMIKLEVDTQSDAFTLFESLNNRGVPLTPIDLIKNTLLGKAESSPDLSIDTAYNRWKEWLEILGDDYSTQERFFRYFYMAMKQDLDIAVRGEAVATRSNLIRIYEALIKKDASSLVAHLTSGVEAMGQLLGATDEGTPDRLRRAFTNLRRAQGLPGHVLLLYLLQRTDKHSLTEDHLVQITNLLTAFFVRRNLTGTPATYAMRSLFMNLVETIRPMTSPEEIIAAIRSELVSVSASDATFREALAGPIYADNTDLARFVLAYLAEQQMTEETKQDLWARTATGRSTTYKWTIEHILPQGSSLPKEWIEMLGGKDAAQSVQSEYVHQLGNLTITVYNASLGNKGFIEKRDRTDSHGRCIGYRNNLSLNADLAQRSSWDAAAIKERTERLTHQTITAFPLS